MIGPNNLLGIVVSSQNQATGKVAVVVPLGGFPFGVLLDFPVFYSLWGICYSGTHLPHEPLLNA